MDPQRFNAFLKERNRILKDIKNFLMVVLYYFFTFENYELEFVVNSNVGLLIRSLCQIHSLYGYPGPDSSDGNITVKKDAVKEMLLNDIKLPKNKRTFVYFYQEAEQDAFWQFVHNQAGELNIDRSLREPAHIFLQLVRGLFGELEEGSDEGRKFLGLLNDGNYLKPVMWAQHKHKPECYGVSLGVRSFVRPLYLYIKLCELRNVASGENLVSLGDVKAYQSVDRQAIIKSTSSNLKRTKYDRNRNPCVSCQVFFDHYENSINAIRKELEFLPFGNCAEYDVVRTNNLNNLLVVDWVADQWELFQSACEKHFQAFNELTAMLNQVDDPSEEIKKYHLTNTRNAKVLKYQRYGEEYQPEFKLIATSYLFDEWQVVTSKKRRRKTEP